MGGPLDTPMEAAGVLPVLQVGPYQPGLHWQVSGVRHSPPFSQCLLQTTAIQEGGKNIRQGRRQGIGGQERDTSQIILNFLFQLFPKN